MVEGVVVVREIKFRAWNQTQMEYSDKLEHFFAMFDNDYNKSPVMQFTGLLDKSGTEIYEGDILEYDYENATVEWNSKYARFEFAMRYDGNDEVCERLSIDNWTSVDHFKVIGNIHQNGNLL